MISLIPKVIAGIVFGTVGLVVLFSIRPKEIPQEINILKQEVQRPELGGAGVEYGIYTNEPYLSNEYLVMAWFTHFNQPLVNNKLKYACREKHRIVITWESISSQDEQGRQFVYELSDIVDGKYDDLIIREISDLADSCPGENIIIRFDHEMDGNGWYPWQGNSKEYIEAWRHIVGLARSINPDVKWLWSPNRGTVHAKRFYPGDNWVDYVGLTLNHKYSTYSDNQEIIESFGKPVIVGETIYPDNINTIDTNIVAVIYFAKKQ